MMLVGAACGFCGMMRADDLPLEVVCKAMVKMSAPMRRALAEVQGDAAAADAFRPFASPKVKFEEVLPFSVDISGAERLYLGSTGSYGGGHSNWGEPTLFDADGQATPLSELSPKIYFVGWSDLKVFPPDGPERPVIGKTPMKSGMFAHVDSCVVFQVDKKYTRFEVKAGIQNSGARGAEVMFTVASKPTERQLARLLAEGRSDPLRAVKLDEGWTRETRDGPLGFWDWVRARDPQAVAQAIENLLALCGDEPALTARLAGLKETKKEGNEPEWLALYLDTLNGKRVYAAFDDAVGQVEAVNAFMAAEGVPTAVFAGDIAALRQQAPEERKKGREAMEAFGQKLAALRRKILFSHPAAQFRDLLVDVRYLPTYHHNVDQYLGRNNKTAPGLLVLEDWKSEAPTERWLTRDALPPGCTQHPDLSYDGKRVIFGFCDHTIEKDQNKRRFLIYEMNLDGSGLRQITGTAADPWDATRRDDNYTVIIEDFDPHYLPDGGFVFTSTRSQNLARCHAGRNAPAFLIHRGELDGTGIRALSWGEANELDPAVLHDGRIIYNRWEYVNRHDCLFHKLWTMKPDGTGAANFYGNLTTTPQSITEPRPIPNSNKVMATGTAHHSFTAGCVILIDPQQGTDGPAPVTRLTPEAKYPEAEGWDTDTYMAPYPLTERLFFAAWSKGPHTHEGHHGTDGDYALYLVFNHQGKAYRERVYRAKEGLSCFTSLPIQPRPVPPVMTSALEPDAAQRTGSFYVQNVYDSVHDLPAGSIRYLRVNELFNQPTPRVPHRGWIMDEVPKGVLGTVPVAENGAVAFTIPSRTPVQLQLLDAEKKCVMNMRSFIYLQDGEQVSCVGCHDDRMRSPLPVNYATVTPAEPQPIPGPDARRGLNYAATVQPVWDRYCIRCHGLDEVEGGVNLTGAYIERDTERYPGGNVRMSRSYEALVTNPKYYKMLDRNNETDRTTPGDYLSPASGLPAWLRKHAKENEIAFDDASWERVITWLDVNAQMYGNYSFNRPEDRLPDPDGEKALREHVRQVLGEAMARQPFEALVNNGCLDESRVLKAPLAAAAGGWGQRPLWNSTADDGYRLMREKAQAALKPLAHRDVDGTCGNPARCRCSSCWVKAADQGWPQKRPSP